MNDIAQPDPWAYPHTIKLTQEEKTAQIIKEYESELIQAHTTDQPIHTATATGMRRALIGVGLMTYEENSVIVDRARKKGKKLRGGRSK